MVTIYPRGGSAIGGGFVGLVLKQDTSFGGPLMQALNSSDVVNFQISGTGVPQFPTYGYLFGTTTSYGSAIDTVQMTTPYSNGIPLHIVGNVGQSTPLLKVK